MSMSLFGLVDCNNFFVSCERVFNPKLVGKSVVVLSSNDGCIVARSEEVKTLGVPMGAPYFKWKKMLERYNVAVFSSNFTLYGDMSQRVMSIIRAETRGTEVYSIDEAFFAADPGRAAEEARRLRAKILKWTGIPVSIGIANTKTLAKIANHVAKKDKHRGGVMNWEECENPDEVLAGLPPSEIWGIGRQYAKLLQSSNIKNVLELKNVPDAWVLRAMSTSGLKTILELRGEPQYGMSEHPDQRKSVVSSRSFGRAVEKKEELQEAISSYLASACETLREEDLVASRLTVYITTNRFDKETYYGNSETIDLPRATAYTPEMLAHAGRALDIIYRQGCLYKKAGVVLTGITRADEVSFGIFDSKNELAKKERLMGVMDKTNQEWGRGTLQLLAEGVLRPWRVKGELKSKRYTTDWNQLLSVQL